MNYPKSVTKLIENFQKLPGVGIKTAERMAFAVMDLEKEDVDEFATSLVDVKKKLKQCKICNHITEDELCDICKDETRNNRLLCIVEDSRDVMAMEKAQVYKGRYHVLNGVISPILGIGPEDLNFGKLIKRIEEKNIEEVIVATNPNIEGETTALYMAKLLSNFNVIVTRIAHGLPVGSDIEYADELTISSALEGRRKM
ncbi:MAG TPA: recombination protein RecR [Tenericutes bacterium]|jgi:recombination protein RecR|nr:recombination protein RecR [Mycoplasmatota bacterium]